MRISDWSSDVCSSDLAKRFFSWSHAVAQFMLQPHAEEAAVRRGVEAFAEIRTYVEAQIDDRLSTGSTDDVLRSEEHTSELQSLMRISYADFCLKKKKLYQ